AVGARESFGGGDRTGWDAVRGSRRLRGPRRRAHGSSARGGGGVIKVAVAGAAGRMGETVCRAVQEAQDMDLVARADPRLGRPVSEALGAGPEVLVDFTVPDSVLDNAREAVSAGVHTVIGTTGFDVGALAEFEGAGANVFVAPNFAIGAVLMMRFAAEAAKHMPAAEIVELHHDGKLDR